MYGHVPASADSEVKSLRDNDNKPWVVYGCENLGRAVGRMVVHHDDIEIEVAFLRECALHGIGHGADSVEDRNDH